MPKTNNTHLITCPYCGWQDNDSWEANHESSDETDCGRCEKPFGYEADVVVTWSTWGVEEDE